MPNEASETGGGSSPLTRGKLHLLDLQLNTPRLIPAHAGKTTPDGGQAGASRAHPRSRGENLIRLGRREMFRGSSPLTRGKLTKDAALKERAGLIPAHAGKTRRGGYQTRDDAAHPRSRGENLLLVLPSGSIQGSSPLTRGKHSLTCAFIKRIGQILESLELCASSGSYSLMDAYATDAPQDQARNTGLALPSSRAAS